MKVTKTFFLILCVTILCLILVACDDTQTDNLDTDTEQYALKPDNFDWVYWRKVKEKEFVGVNGETVRYKRYENVGPDEAFVIFLNGRTEFIEKYDPLFTSLTDVPWQTHLAETLADLPVTFFAIDHAGQGESGGLPSHIDSFDTFVENVRELIHQVKKLENHKKPIYIMAHSMGSLIATRFAQKYPEYVDGLILSSPMFGMQMPAGVTAEQVQQLAQVFATPQPHGLGLADRCAMNTNPQILGIIAMCMGDPNGVCQPCFMGDRDNDTCNALLASWDMENWDLIDSTWATVQASVGCPKEEDPVKRDEQAVKNCTLGDPDFTGVSLDFEYCHWSNAHELSGPAATFGWLNESFNAIDTMKTPGNMDLIKHIPTLLLSTPIDPIVVATTHSEFCNAMDDCTLVEFKSNPAENQFWFHELLAELNRASVITEIKYWIAESLFE